MQVFLTTILALTPLAMTSTHATLPTEMTSLMDTTVEPCENFYMYSCGKWIATHHLKPSDTSIDSSFSVINDRNEQVIQDIVKENLPIVSQLWDSCMAHDKLTALGNEPLQADLIRIASAKNRREVLKLAGEYSRTGPSVITAFDVKADPIDAKTNMLHVHEADLTLPSVDYYSKDKFPSVETEYRAYINDLIQLSGFSFSNNDPIRSAADIVIEIEQTIVDIKNRKDKLKDSPHVFSIAEAIAKWPITFGAYSRGMGLLKKTIVNKVHFSSIEYFDMVEKWIKSISMTDLKVYTAFVMVNSRVSWLGEDFFHVWFPFIGQKIDGQQHLTPRKTWCVQRQLEYLPDLVGTYYYKKSFDSKQEESAIAIIKWIQEAMEEHIANFSWLDMRTRIGAKKKLDKVLYLIGKSKVPKSYTFTLSRDNYAANVYTILSHSFDDKMRNAGKPVNRMEWSISPAEVNLYYSPFQNKIMIPAGILQPPFFNGPDAHPARNFGAIGAFIGHELIHGFDSNGRRYDGDGNQRLWMTMSTGKDFFSRATCMKDQYSTFLVHGEHSLIGNVNGAWTLRENIADNGGVSLAWDAYRKYMVAVNPKTDGVTPEEGDQMFFIAYSQNWCAKARDATISLDLERNPHSPAQWRANGVVMNNNDFAKVFKCKVDAPMNPTNKCQIW